MIKLLKFPTIIFLIITALHSCNPLSGANSVSTESTFIAILPFQSIVPVSGGIINNTRQVNYDAKFSIKTLNSSGAEVHYLNSPYNESIQNQNNSITIGFFPPDCRKKASIPLSGQFIPECILKLNECGNFPTSPTSPYLKGGKKDYECIGLALNAPQVTITLSAFVITNEKACL
jgi:hypothetical protein